MKDYEGSKACFWQKLKKNAYAHFNLPSLLLCNSHPGEEGEGSKALFWHFSQA
jgi:hypothetical protein